MAKMVPIALPPALVEKIREAAESLDMTADELLDELLTQAMAEHPEISALLTEAHAEVSKRGISMEQYTAEAEAAKHMADLVIRLLKAR